MHVNTISNQDIKSTPSAYSRIVINFFIVICILIVVALNIVFHTRTNSHSIHSLPTRLGSITENTNQLLTSLNILDSHLKSYLITSNNTFTSDTKTLIIDVDNYLMKLNQLTQDTIKQHELVKLLEKNINERMDLFSKIRALRENDEFTSLNCYELMHGSQLLTEVIANTSAQLINDANSKLSEYYVNLDQDETKTTHLIIIGSSAILLLLLFIAYFYNREQSKNAKFNQSSMDTYSELFSILECTSDMIIAVDLNLCVINFNSAYGNDFQQLFGKKVNVGASLEDAYENLTEVKMKVLSLWRESLAGNVFKKAIHFKVNSVNYGYEITSNPIINSSHDIIGAVQVIRNITQRAEDQLQLQTAYEELNVGMEELKERNEKITLLVEMSDVILACETLIELSEVIGKFCNRILNFSGGTLYIMHASKNYLESTASWGKSNVKEHTFGHEACWALRLGKVHISSIDSKELLCSHIEVNPNNKCSYLCVPLIAQNDIYGLLHLESQESNSHLPIKDSELSLIKSLAELTALSLANVRLRENLRYHSIRDPLTSLHNRRYLDSFMLKEITKLNKSKTPTCLLMLDLDHFKSINDTYGHDIGDLALKEFSVILANYAYVNDLAIRYGGEEFILLLCDTTQTLALQRAEAIRMAAEKIIIPYHNQQLGIITVSIGLAQLKPDTTNYQDLIEAADKALYQAKNTGRNKTVVAQINNAESSR